jgi:hypothetical protein
MKDETYHAFADRLEECLEERGWSILTLAERAELTYEHARKLVRGLAFPSKRLLTVLCDLLGLHGEEIERLVIADKIRRKYGTIPLEIAGKNPRFERFEHLLPKLTEDQFLDIYAVAEGIVRRSRQRRLSNTNGRRIRST